MGEEVERGLWTFVAAFGRQWLVLTHEEAPHRGHSTYVRTLVHATDAV